jgi:hypothetical protein
MNVFNTSSSNTQHLSSTSARPTAIANDSILLASPPVVTKDLELEAVSFIVETVDMVERGVLLPTPTAATFTPGARRPWEKKPQTETGGPKAEPLTGARFVNISQSPEKINIPSASFRC